MFSLRQLSTIDTIAATRGPASSLPMWIQFLRLCKDLHKRRYDKSGIRQSSALRQRDFRRLAFVQAEAAGPLVFT
jgi:hypothetical protein